MEPIPDKVDSGKRYRTGFFLLLLVFISALFVAMIRGFLMTILLAAIFSALAQPMFSRFAKWFGGRRGLASIVTLLIIMLVIVIPLLTLLGIVAGQAVKVSSSVGPWMQEQIDNPDQLAQRLEQLPGYDRVAPYRAEILTRFGQFVGATGNFLVDGLSAATKGTVAFFFQFFLMLYSMFFFLKDGGRILEKFLYYMPLQHEEEVRMADKFVSVTRATLKGTVIIGVIQGSFAGLALAIVGVNGAVFWATIMTVLSIIPGIGTALVWFPVAVYFLVTGKFGAGLFLLVFCGGVVGSVDNFLRPRLVGRDTQMHDLLILFATLGGILFFGVVGIIIGPIIAALFVTVWDIYGITFKDILPPVGPLGANDGVDEPDTESESDPDGAQAV